jgi:threonylcarbamoyladenosine tRNA methylthiotransferase MtaB
VVRARGTSISDRRENVLNNVRQAVSGGFKEITLTGINLGTWGMDLPKPETFSSLVEDILALPGDFRVRISSINPMEIEDRLIQLMADSDKLCSHFHIPLQSGDDTILGRMRRNYNTRQYLNVVHKAVEKIPGLGLGADVIIGFPGETDEHFENTRSLIEGLPFSYLHTFSYSPRRGTEAYGFKETMPKATRKGRSKVLTDLANQKSQEFRRSFIGKTVAVLIENQRDHKTGYLKGHSEQFIPVLVEGGDRLTNQIIPVTITQVENGQVFGCP